jgi:hypothetical protein
MLSGPCVTVHDLGQARTVLALREDAVLLSAPAAALSMGCLWWAALLKAAGAGCGVLDCADAPGLAMAALRVGLKALVLEEAAPARAAVAGAAAGLGAIILPCRPLSLDLGRPGGERKLAAWLQRDFVPGLSARDSWC